MSGCPVCGAKTTGEILPGLLSCGGCGLVYKAQRAFSEPVYAAGLEQGIYGGGKAGLFSEALDFLDKILPARGRLLDVGCAGGGLMKAAAARGWEPEGVELSPVLAARALAAGFKVQVRPLETAELQNGAFSAVTAFEVLSQVEDPQMSLAKIHAPLKPGGAVYIREFNASFHLPLARLEAALLPEFSGLKPSVLHDFNFRAATLRCMLGRAGFTEIKIRNSRPTAGDPYRTGGRLGGFFTAVLKVLYYYLAQGAWMLSFGRLYAGSSLIITARK